LGKKNFSQRKEQKKKPHLLKGFNLKTKGGKKKNNFKSPLPKTNPAGAKTPPQSPPQKQEKKTFFGAGGSLWGKKLEKKKIFGKKKTFGFF